MCGAIIYEAFIKSNVSYNGLRRFLQAFSEKKKTLQAYEATHSSAQPKKECSVQSIAYSKYEKEWK